MKISDSEMEIMRVIWSCSEPISASRISELVDEDWKPTTVLTFLKRLCDKGALTYKRVGKTNYYWSKISEEEYKSLQTKSFLCELHSGSVKSFLAALYNDKKPDKKELDEIRQWFENI